MLFRLLDVDARTVQKILRAAPTFYITKVRVIGGKERTLHIPRKPLRTIQRKLLRNVLQKLPPHDAAGCAKGRGPVWAAKRHQRRARILHTDIRNFYPSVTPAQIRAAVLRAGFGPAVADIITGLVSVKNQLPQGAPTSPAIAELVLRTLDHRLYNLARKNGFTYTRYADDIVLSGGVRLEGFVKHVANIIEDEEWTPNAKGGILPRQGRQSVLGLVVNVMPNVSADYYHDLRRLLRLANAGKVELSEKDWRSIRGKVSWISYVNPKRGETLRKLLPSQPHNPTERSST